MVKIQSKTCRTTTSIQRPKKLTKGFGRTCKTCAKRFGTLSRLKEHEKRCKYTGFYHEDFVLINEHQRVVRPKRSEKMTWITVCSTIGGKDVKLWAGTHPVTKNKVFSPKEWPNKAEIERYFKIKRGMFDSEGKTIDRWKTAVEWK